MNFFMRKVYATRRKEVKIVIITYIILANFISAQLLLVFFDLTKV